MKLFVFIFSFYLLALGCVPCGDIGECNVEGAQKVSIATQQQEHQHESESCTPFCSCACCSAVSFYQPLSFTKTTPFVFKKINFYYGNCDFHSYDFHSIWQPPRMS